MNCLIIEWLNWFFYSYWSNGICVSLLTYSNACTLDSQCNVNVGLYCVNLACSCASTQYWTGSTCSNVLSYNGPCSTDNWCNRTRGLACYSGLCQCNSLNYWSSASLTCGNLKVFLFLFKFLNDLFIATKLLYNVACSAAIVNQCDNNRYLYCISSLCQCNSTMVSAKEKKNGKYYLFFVFSTGTMTLRFAVSLLEIFWKLN